MACSGSNLLAPMMKYRISVLYAVVKQATKQLRGSHLADALFATEFLPAAAPGGFWFCGLKFGRDPGGFPGFPTSDGGGSASSSEIVAAGGLPGTTGTAARMGKGGGVSFGGGNISRERING